MDKQVDGAGFINLVNCLLPAYRFSRELSYAKSDNIKGFCRCNRLFNIYSNIPYI